MSGFGAEYLVIRILESNAIHVSNHNDVCQQFKYVEHLLGD